MTQVDHVARKICELQESGCGDKIVWSRHGAIAYIRNGLVYVCFLVCKTGSEWCMSDPLVISNLDTIHRGRPVVHLSWSSPGTDLACIDDHGGLSIFTMGVGGSAMMTCLHYPSPVAQQQPVELNRVVGFKWLDLEKGVLFASPATIHNNASKNGTTVPGGADQPSASYGVFQGKSVGPNHPVQGKYACMSLNRRGVIRLYAQTASSDARYYEMSVSLESSGGSNQNSDKTEANSKGNYSISTASISSNDIISHAVIQGSREDLMYINAYFPVLRSMKTFAISIKWSSSITGNRQQTAGYNMSEVATLDIKRVCCTTLSPVGSPLDNELTHLVSPLPPLSKNQMEPFDFTILALFTSATTRVTTLYKYELKKKPLPFHSSIYGLNGGNASQDNPPSESEFQLISTSEYKIPVVNIGWGFNDLESYIVKADGTVDFEYRGTKIAPDAITSPIDIGFSFPEVGGGVGNVCLSPTLCSYVYLDSSPSTGETSANVNPLKLSYLKMPLDRNLLSETAISLAVIHSISCFSSMCSDDIFCLIKQQLDSCPPDSRDNLLQAVLRESHRAINFTLDIPKDYHIDKVMVNPSLQRLLSLQMVLGTTKDWDRNLMGSIGWAVLNLRLLAFSLTFTLRTASTQQQKSAANSASPLPAEVLEARAANTLSMIGLTRWCTDFIALLSQELYLISLEDNVQAYLAKHNMKSLALALLLAKVPRMLLMYSLRGVRGLEQVAGRLADTQGGNNGGPVRGAFHRIRDTILLSPVSLATFDRILAETESSLKSNLTNVSPTNMLAIEQSLIFNCTISQQLLPVAEVIIQSFNKIVIAETDLPKLYFYDVSWLGVQPVEDSNNATDSNDFFAYVDNNLPSKVLSFQRTDMLRKQVLSQNEPRERKCVRCGSLSVWDQPGSPSQWTMAFQKNCFCGGNWYPL